MDERAVVARVLRLARSHAMIVVWIALASVLGFVTAAVARTGVDAHLVALRLVGYPGNEQAPSFSMSTADGQRLSLPALRGSVVVLTFWATWCEPCRNDLRMFEILHREMGGTGLAVVGVSRETATAIADYGRTIGLTFRLAQDAHSEVAHAYGVMALPTTIVIAKDGRAVARAVGTRDWTSDAARALVRALLAESASGQ